MRRNIRKVAITLAVLFALSISVAYAGTSDQGYYLVDGASGGHVIGIQAMVSSMSTVSLNHGTPSRNMEIFAPSLLPLPSSCLEISVRTIRLTNMSVTAHELGVVDSCMSPATWKAVWVMDATFKSKYERSQTYYGFHAGSGYITDKMLKVKVYRYNPTGNCWGAYVWNYNTSAWDTIYTKCGTIVGREGWYGWTVFETYGFNTASSTPICVSLGSYGVSQARDLKFVKDDLSLVAVSAADHYSDILDWNGCWSSYDWQFIENGIDQWAVCDDAHDIYCEGA